VTGWQSDGRSVVVRIAAADYCTQKLIITGGAWAANILYDLDLPLRGVRKIFAWFDPLLPDRFAEGAIPIFGFPPCSFYGIPNTGEQTSHPIDFHRLGGRFAAERHA